MTKKLNIKEIIANNASIITPAMDTDIVMTIVKNNSDIFNLYDADKRFKIAYRKEILNSIKRFLAEAGFEYEAATIERTLGKRNPVRVNTYGDALGRPVSGMFIGITNIGSGKDIIKLNRTATAVNDIFNKYADVY